MEGNTGFAAIALIDRHVADQNVGIGHLNNLTHHVFEAVT